MKKKNSGVKTENRQTKSGKTLYKMDRRHQNNTNKLGTNWSKEKKLDALRGVLCPAVDDTRLIDDISVNPTNTNKLRNVFYYNFYV